MSRGDWVCDNVCAQGHTREEAPRLAHVVLKCGEVLYQLKTYPDPKRFPETRENRESIIPHLEFKPQLWSCVGPKPMVRKPITPRLEFKRLSRWPFTKSWSSQKADQPAAGIQTGRQ